MMALRIMITMISGNDDNQHPHDNDGTGNDGDDTVNINNDNDNDTLTRKSRRAILRLQMRRTLQLLIFMSKDRRNCMQIISLIYDTRKIINDKIRGTKDLRVFTNTWHVFSSEWRTTGDFLKFCHLPMTGLIYQGGVISHCLYKCKRY